MVGFALRPDGDARLLRLDGELAALDASRASAPGSRLECVRAGRTWRLKVHRCVRNGERFTIEGRFIDLTRRDREELRARFGAG